MNSIYFFPFVHTLIQSQSCNTTLTQAHSHLHCCSGIFCFPCLRYKTSFFYYLYKPSLFPFSFPLVLALRNRFSHGLLDVILPMLLSFSQLFCRFLSSLTLYLLTIFCNLTVLLLSWIENNIGSLMRHG